MCYSSSYSSSAVMLGPALLSCPASLWRRCRSTVTRLTWSYLLDSAGPVPVIGTPAITYVVCLISLVLSVSDTISSFLWVEQYRWNLHHFRALPHKEEGLPSAAPDLLGLTYSMVQARPPCLGPLLWSVFSSHG